MIYIATGSKIGVHCTQGVGSGIARLREMVSRGVVCPVWKVVDNLGAALEARATSPQSILIYRFVNPDDAAQDIDQPNYDFVGAVNRTFVLLHDRFRSPAEIAILSDPRFYVEILNEADPPGVEGWRNFGVLCCMMADRATSERIKIVLPAFNSGTPEYAEFQAFVSRGVMQALAAGGHLWAVHEGPFEVTDPVITYGPIPGAPSVPGAGVLTLRYRYWLHYLKQAYLPIPPLVVTEFYAGGGHGHEPGAESAGQIAARLAAVDAECRKDPAVLAVLPFTLGGSEWGHSNYDFAYSDLINYMAAVKDDANAAPTPAPAPLPGDGATHTVTARMLNVRAHPWTGQIMPLVLRTLKLGDRVTVWGEYRGWGALSKDSHEWVSLKYLRAL